MFPVAESDALHARVRAYVVGSLRGDATEDFDDVAVAIARFQASNSAPIARLARARHVDLARVSRACDIPAVPCDVFRLTRVAVHPKELDVAVFRTSGTSLGAAARGEHAFRTTTTYELSTTTWSERFLFPDHRDLFALVLAQEPSTQPDSSLGFMLGQLIRSFCTGQRFFLRAEKDRSVFLDLPALAAEVERLRAEGRPAVVFATAFALVHALEGLGGATLVLPEGSRVMQTGGFKGLSREVPADSLRSRVSTTFGVPEAWIVGEYGMTELSSCLYEGTLAASAAHPATVTRTGVFLAPPWMRVIPVHPESLEPVADGEVGLARIVDLANVDSAVAVQTSDRVRTCDGGVQLLGRAPSAPPRGCSIAVDELLDSHRCRL